MKKNNLREWSLKRFDRWAEVYDTSILQQILFSKTQKEVLKVVSSFIRKGYKILDLACGTGRFARKLRKSTKKKIGIYGVDSSVGMIKKARGRTKTIEWAVGEAENIPHETDLFDVVVCTHAFHHFEDKHKALREIHRVLRRGGMVIIGDGAREGVLGKVISVATEIAEKNVYHPTQEKMRDLLTNAGFKKIHQYYINKLVPTLLTMGIKK